MPACGRAISPMSDRFMRACGGAISVMDDNLASGSDPIGTHLPSTTRIPIVLCNAGYNGTLAAIRSLGRAGVPVISVDPAMLALGRYSRYSKLHLACPPFE